MNMMVAMYDKKSADDKKMLRGIEETFKTELFG